MSLEAEQFQRDNAAMNRMRIETDRQNRAASIKPVATTPCKAWSTTDVAELNLERVERDKQARQHMASLVKPYSESRG